MFSSSNAVFLLPYEAVVIGCRTFPHYTINVALLQRHMLCGSIWHLISDVRYILCPIYCCTPFMYEDTNQTTADSAHNPAMSVRLTNMYEYFGHKSKHFGRITNGTTPGTAVLRTATICRTNLYGNVTFQIIAVD
jgi:hypothetical protein